MHAMYAYQAIDHSFFTHIYIHTLTHAYMYTLTYTHSNHMIIMFYILLTGN